MQTKSLLAVLVLLLTCTLPAWAAEEILSYHSDITVQQDGSMRVAETIRVRAEGKQIKRGIYRDFPTDYKDRLGNNYRVAFNLVSVMRDGNQEDYHTERRRNGVRVYIGHKNRFLDPGEYSYRLVYTTNRQLGFFEQHDELYWNVTGNGWVFPIRYASATVHLPEGIPAGLITTEAYTGRQGAKGQNYNSRAEGDSTALFVTTAPLKAYEGLTIVTGWPKGYVTAPTTEDELNYFFEDNRVLLIGLVGLVMVFLYYLLVWHFLGRDIPAGVIAPEYFPPKGYSSASLRFVREMHYDHKAFATALVSLAVKGAIVIEEEGRKFTLQKTDKADDVEKAPGEKAILHALFVGGTNSITLKNSNHATIRSALKAHEKSLKRNYEKHYFITNGFWVVPGGLLSIATLAAMMLNLFNVLPLALIFTSMGIVWGLVLALGIKQGVRSWRIQGSNLPAVMQLISMAVGFGFPFYVLHQIGMDEGFSAPVFGILILILALFSTNVAFHQWLKAPTLAGRKLLDKLEGFRLYLNVAEKDELRMQGAPGKTIDLFEIYLPYAMALDVENRWAERFAALFAAAGQDDRHVRWYRGSHRNYSDIGRFSSTIGSSLSTAISSSSTAPGSSSGGGGGGSSGGGGGGGGGGGW